MKNARSAWALSVIVLFALNTFTIYAAESSCIGCHSNEATMKKLVVVPSNSSAEGEG